MLDDVRAQLFKWAVTIMFACYAVVISAFLLAVVWPFVLAVAAVAGIAWAVVAWRRSRW